MYSCPICQKGLKSKQSLDSHMDKFHKDTADTSSEDKPDVDAQDTGLPPAEDLELDTAEAKESAGESTGVKYHCIACGQYVVRNEAACPGCGCALDWSALNA